jgi:hypothetical protein
MTFAYPVPVWAVALGLVVIIALAIRTYAGFRDRLQRRQRAILTVLRALTLAVLALFLLRPIMVSPDTSRTDAIVPILIDTSRSMRIADADGQRRIDAAKSLARSVEKSIGQRFKVDVLSIGEGVSSATIDRVSPDARSSDLRAAITAARERYRGQRLAGLVLLSDGADTGEPPPDDDAIDVPVFAFGVGAPRVARDREVLGVSVGDPELTDSTVELSATIVSHGFGNSAPVEVRVLENGRVVHLRRIAPRDDVPWTERFRVAPRQDAASVYSVEIQPDASELTPDNNKQAVLVRPPGRPRRLLLVEGAPGFEHSFIKRAWTRDRGLEVDSVVRKGRNDTGDETYYVQAGRGRADVLAEGYPSRRDVLFQYDAIVLANVEPGLLTEAQTALTADFVAERGGGLLMLGSRTLAPDSLARSALQELLPVDLSDRAGRGGRGVPMTSIFSGATAIANAAALADRAIAAEPQTAPQVAPQTTPQTAPPPTGPPATGPPATGAPATARGGAGRPAGAATSTSAPTSSGAQTSTRVPASTTASGSTGAATASGGQAGANGQALGLNKVALTPEGERHAITQLGVSPDESRQQWAALPALASSTALGGAKPGASVLAIVNGAGGHARPLIAVQRYGHGRSMVFAGEASWRWRMRMPSSNRSFDTFWRQAGRWLAGDSPDPIAVTVPSPPAGAVARLDVDVRDAEFHGIPDARVALRVTDPSGAAHDITAMADPVAGGRYHATFRSDQSGLFRIETDVRRGAAQLGAVNDWMLVGGVDREMADPRMNADVLQRLATASGGAVLTADGLRDLPARLAAAVNRAANAPRRERELWHTPWAFLLVMGCIAVEWTCRRRWGLR